MKTVIVIFMVLVIVGCSTTSPSQEKLNQLKSGMMLDEFKAILGSKGKTQPNPSPEWSTQCYDFDGHTVLAQVHASPKAPCAYVEEFVIVRDGLTISERETERQESWGKWVRQHQINIKGVPNNRMNTDQ